MAKKKQKKKIATRKTQNKAEDAEKKAAVTRSSSADSAAARETSESKPKHDKGKDRRGGSWYVVHTYSGHENKVAATLQQKIAASHLEDLIFDVMVPTQEKIEVREGKKQTLRERILPGYVLVKMKLDNQTWYTVRSTAGVTGFVGIGNKPTPLDPKEVETIQKFSKLEAPTYKASFSVGEAVKIIDGPFSDFIGSVDEINEEKGKIKVLVSIFGRETPVELDFLQVNKL